VADGSVAGGSPGARRAGRPARRLRRWIPRTVLLAAVLMATAGCQSTTFTRLGLPVPVTRQGEVVVTLWRGSWIAALCVGAVVWGAILWAVIFHRKRTDVPPRQVRYNLPIEIMYTVIPFIMVGVFFFFTARDENYIDKLPPHPDVSVTVYGYQWSWEFQYPGYKVPGAASGSSPRPGRPGRAGCRCWRSPRTGPSVSTSSPWTWCTRSGSSRSSSSAT